MPIDTQSSYMHTYGLISTQSKRHYPIILISVKLELE